jgi:oxygen-independent coproporphyrinogen-3 oxidase
MSDRGDFHGGAEFSTIFLGGGTPSLLPAGELECLFDRLRLILNIAPVEFTVESNPGTVDKKKLESFHRMGADRISFGVQAAQDLLLRRIGRIHTWADFVRSYELAREAGFANVNADMMTGLPGQTVDDAVDTAAKLVALGVEHVSCYGLIAEDGTPLARAIQKGDEIPPGDDEERGMFHAAQAVLEDAGMRRYEISNFAKPGFECLHNLNYWHNGDWLGLGLGAASHFAGWRRENHCDLDEYMAALESGVLPPADEHVIGADEAVFETIMLETRLVDGIDFQRFEMRHGFEFLLKYQKQADKLIAGGLMKRTPGGVALTEKGLDLQNTALMEFMD